MLDTYPLIRGYYNLEMKRYFWGIRIINLFEFQNAKYFGPFQSFIKYLVTWKVIWRAAKGRLNQHLYLPIGQLLMVVVFSLEERQRAAALSVHGGTNEWNQVRSHL